MSGSSSSFTLGMLDQVSTKSFSSSFSEIPWKNATLHLVFLAALVQVSEILLDFQMTIHSLDPGFLVQAVRESAILHVLSPGPKT